MKILVVSDAKEVDSFLNSSQPDLLICLGDIYYGDIVKLDKSFSCKKIGVLGNHDPFSLYEGTDFEHIHEKVITFNGYTFAGFGGCPRYNNKNVPQFTEEETLPFMENLEKVNFFIAHSNAQFAPSFDDKDAHRGFKSFAHYIQTKKPHVFFHGHTHETNTAVVGDTIISSVYHFNFFEF